MFHTIHFKMVLIADKGKITSKCHNEFLDIMYNFLLNHALIYIFVITLSYLFYIADLNKPLLPSTSQAYQQKDVLERNDEYSNSVPAKSLFYSKFSNGV